MDLKRALLKAKSKPQDLERPVLFVSKRMLEAMKNDPHYSQWFGEYEFIAPEPIEPEGGDDASTQTETET